MAMIEASKSREAADAMASIAIAKRFPRDEAAAFNKVMVACRRPSLAELSQYEYSRGGTKVTGPSIHLAKAIASAWGNMEFGWRELSRQVGESTVESFSWDKETNTRMSQVFQVKHWRDTKQGGYALKDERDIYELCANQAARRMRACILSIVPGDVVESALLECDKTLSGQNKAPLIDRIRKMAAAFADAGVSHEMLETFLGCKLDACSEANLTRLRKIYAAIRDGVAKIEDHFKPATPEPRFDSAKAKDDEIPMGQPAPAAPATDTPPAFNPIKAITNLCKLEKIDPELVLGWLRIEGRIADEVTTLPQAALVAPDQLRLVCDEWANVLPLIKGGR
jgi:hypothetical protein